MTSFQTTLLFVALAAQTLAQLRGGVRYGGINIAGCDFGCSNDGTCNGVDCPSQVGPTQMHHFVADDGFNVFRLPVGWQYLVDHKPDSSALSTTFFPTYDALVQSCLKLKANCIIDIHN